MAAAEARRRLRFVGKVSPPAPPVGGHGKKGCRACLAVPVPAKCGPVADAVHPSGTVQRPR
ncbi:hypothetical protein JCM9534A_49340 [Catenuloplanes indicus JCM 9534]